MSVTLEMPKLSDTMTAGTLVKWLKSVGDPIMRGEPYADVETDKATMPLICPRDGELLEILAIEGAVVPVGEPVAQISSREEVDASSESVENSKTPAPAMASDDVEVIPGDEEVDHAFEDDQTEEDNSLIDQEHGEVESTDIDDEEASPESINTSVEEEKHDASDGVHEVDKGTNMPAEEDLEDDDRVEEHDIIKTASQSNGTIEEEANDDKLGAFEEEIEVGEINRPLITLEKEIDASFLTKAKSSINDYLLKSRKSNHENPISINDLIICSVGKAVECIPEINATINKGMVKIHEVLNLSFSINLPNGIANPVIKNITSKNLMLIAEESRNLIQKARTETLEDEDESDATFSISNIAAHGIDSYKAPLSRSVAACLSVASPIEKAIVNESGQVGVGLRLRLSLSCDSRALDSSIGASFLKELAEILANPSIATL